MYQSKQALDQATLDAYRICMNTKEIFRCEPDTESNSVVFTAHLNAGEAKITNALTIAGGNQITDVIADKELKRGEKIFVF
jgi:hypothetical protein